MLRTLCFNIGPRIKPQGDTTPLCSGDGPARYSENVWIVHPGQQDRISRTTANRKNSPGNTEECM